MVIHHCCAFCFPSYNRSYLSLDVSEQKRLEDANFNWSVSSYIPMALWNREGFSFGLRLQPSSDALHLPLAEVNLLGVRPGLVFGRTVSPRLASATTDVSGEEKGPRILTPEGLIPKAVILTGWRGPEVEGRPELRPIEGTAVTIG